MVLGRREPHHGPDESGPSRRLAEPLPEVGATSNADHSDPGIALTHQEADLTAVRTVPISLRPNKVRAEEFAAPPAAGARTFADFLEALPDVLVARDFRRVVDA